jgi:ribosomal protein S27E
MRSFFNRYNAAVRQTHGWNIELQCPQCGLAGLPRYEGWMQNIAMNSGDKPTIYAKVACSRCGKSLRDEAGGKLFALFTGVAVPAQNAGVIRDFILGLFIVPLVFAAMLFLGVQKGWWSYSAFVVLALSAVLIQPLVMLMRYRIAMLRSRCDCGDPNYVFLGHLGRTDCYRCSSCGRMLRLRD